MRSVVLSCAALFIATIAGPALADAIDLQYTTFGGNIPMFEGPLTPAMGTAVVNGNSATLTSNNAEAGAVWMDTSLNTQANFVSLKFDLNILSQVASGYDQNFGGAETLGGVRIAQNGIFAESFQFMPTDPNNGYFAFRNFNNSAVENLGDYTTNTLYHIQLDADYVNGKAYAYINGVLANSSGFPLRSGTGPGGTTSEIFVYLNGATAMAPDEVHNSFTIGETAAPLPGTASAGMICLGGLVVGRVIRRRRTAARA